jgi:hypothetical protein
MCLKERYYAGPWKMDLKKGKTGFRATHQGNVPWGMCVGSWAGREARLVKGIGEAHH